jgi:hypothetical protein
MRLALVLALSLSSPAAAQTFHVAPYVQDVTTDRAWIVWETNEGDESAVDFGASAAALDRTATGTMIESEGGHRIHEVELTGLSAATQVHYRVRTGALASDTFHFTTAPRSEDEVSFRMIAMSDMQIDRASPDVYRSVIHDGILDWLAGEGGSVDTLAFVILPGDLVDDGNVFESWADELFDPAADLMRHVAFYPVLGNHEENAVHYYRYFHLPDNGSTRNRDQWWAMSWSNVRVIGMDSNLLFLAGDQEAFLDRELRDACTDETVDFVFVQMHHAHRSELWPVGEAPFATHVVERMNRFSEECGKPSAHFHGHTHGYARGASRDHAHVWINVASAGGNLDYWGEYTQRDVDEIEVSQDEYGFVVVDVTAGDDPSFRIRRISRGNEAIARDNEVRDELTVRRYAEPPNAPAALSPRGVVARACTLLEAGPYEDPDDEAHAATHWQVSRSCDDFDPPVLDVLRTRTNWYDGADLAQDDDLSDEPFAELDVDTYFCWRARYRDAGLSWSAWSEPVAFRIEDGGAESCVDERPLEPPDAGRADPDAGVTEEDSGCGCRAGVDRTPAWPLLAFALLYTLRRGR